MSIVLDDFCLHKDLPENSTSIHLFSSSGGFQAHRGRARRGAILDRFLLHAVILEMPGRSYRLKNRGDA